MAPPKKGFSNRFALPLATIITTNINLIMSDSLWHFLQTSDSAFPVGGFSHSFGLEGMVQANLIKTPEALDSFLTTSWIPILEHIDFPLIRLTRNQYQHREVVYRLDQLAWACRATSEVRRAQIQMGRQRLKLVADIKNHKLLSAYYEAAQRDDWMANWPVVWGLESGILNHALNATLISFAYQSIVGLLAASTKLLRIGPTQIQHILHRQEAAIQQAIISSAAVTEDTIGWFSPMLDITGSCHEHAYTRLFIS